MRQELQERLVGQVWTTCGRTDTQSTGGWTPLWDSLHPALSGDIRSLISKALILLSFSWDRPFGMDCGGGAVRLEDALPRPRGFLFLKVGHWRDNLGEKFRALISLLLFTETHHQLPNSNCFSEPTRPEIDSPNSKASGRFSPLSPGHLGTFTQKC